MGLFEGLKYYLSGSDSEKSYGKSKSVKQIKKDAVTFSNACWNDTIRKELQKSSFDYRAKIYMVNQLIQKAQEKAIFNDGTFVMDEDIQKQYNDLILLHKEKVEQLIYKKECEQETEILENDKHKNNIVDSERKIESFRNVWSIQQPDNIAIQTTDMFHRKPESAVSLEEKELRSKSLNMLEQYGFSDIKIELGKAYETINVYALKAEKEFTFWFKCEQSVLDNPDAMDILTNCLSMLYESQNGNFEEKLEGYFKEKKYYDVKILKSSCEVTRGYFSCEIGKCTFKYYAECIPEMITKEQLPNEKTIDFDSMTGLEFEGFCAEILEKNGYDNVSVTRGSGDQGVDIIAYRDGVKYGFQCKCYTADIGNKAVQEIYAGKTYYQCHVGIVLTNRHFTPAAIDLAKKNGIVLWDRSELLELIEKAK
jgi:hypothetical protein